MPTIPTHESQITPVVGGGSTIMPNLATGTAIENMGKTVDSIADKFKRANEVTQYNENMRNLRKELTSLRFSFAERPDFEEFPKDFQRDSTLIVKKYSEGMADNSLWGQFEARMDGAINNTEISVRTVGREKQIDFGRASYTSTMGELADEYGKATEQEKVNIKSQANDMSMLNVDAGYISNQEAQSSVKQFNYNAIKADSWYTARALGYKEGIKFIQNESNFPSLNKSDRNTMVSQLRRDWNIEKVEIKEEEKKVDNLTYESFLEQLVSWEEGEGSLPSHGEIMQSPISDPKWKAQLMEYMDAVGREKNPFLNSDPQKFGEVIGGIIMNSGSWSKGDIISLMGKGLSTKDTLFALKQFEAITKVPEPKKNSQLILGIKTLDRALRDGMFIGEELEKATDLEVINNYAMHAKTIAELVNRVNEGEDAIDVAKQLMKPYVDKKIRAFYKVWWDKFFNPEEYREENIREDAIQKLQEEGDLITEGTIQRTIEGMRKENLTIPDEEPPEPIKTPISGNEDLNELIDKIKREEGE